MLVLTRKSNHSFMIGDEIEVTVLSIIGKKVSCFGLGCTAGATQRNSPAVGRNEPRRARRSRTVALGRTDKR
jgi:hypothetical protein